MKYLLPILSLVTGCVPFHSDFSVSWGENQSISRTVTVEQSTKEKEEEPRVVVTPILPPPN